MRSPFCFYLTVAVGLNVPPVVFAGQALANGNNCAVALQWLMVNAFFCIVNVAAAFYISGKVVQPPPDDGNGAPFIAATVDGGKEQQQQPYQQQQQQLPNGIKKFWQGHTSANEARLAQNLTKFGRVREVLCYDPIVAVYIIIGIGYIVWQSMGFGRMNEAAECGEDGLISSAVMCGFLFISLGATAFGCSVCCLR
eukprot:CAMPEP_0201697878 /NCGR_PEP_ID=MMETSP0578-20130828/14998_1 /ASSEMBLY_ACC=CAM_ASM_000663 /TAXON_ID=267565 /ORGANISM="Skeletonema grethea, Strain CCMP 1804" /LENGTH=195 /DNA_ID=CAMNT_0048184235 /DNA_START=173 /DNA_END=760 /DNA_ORIENTATION=+